MVDDYWPMLQTGPGTLIFTSGSVEYYIGPTDGSSAYPQGYPNPNGDTTWGSEVDRKFVRFINPAYCVWDLGKGFSEVVVFPYVDGATLQEGLEFKIWGSNDFDACHPSIATWKEADLERIYRKGWSDAGEDTYTVCSDDFVSVWDWKCGIGSDAGYRFIKVQSIWSGAGYDDPEIDAVKGVSPGLCDWQMTIVERGKVFSYTSIAIGGDGKMHIAYGEEQLYYIVCDGYTCQKEKIESGGVGAYCSLALDEWDNPAISYYDTTNGDLKYVWWDGTSWQKQIVDSSGDVGSYTSLAFSSSGNPAISYYDATNDDLKYAWWDGTSWQLQTVDSQDWVGLYTSLAFDSLDNPAISYYHATNDNLKYAQWNSVESEWETETLDSQGDIGQYTSLAFDSSDNPAIAYHDVTKGNLKYAQRKAASWNITTVDDSDYTGFYTSLAFDSSDNPAISYYNPTKSDLKYTHWDGTSWQIQAVDKVGDVGSYTSLALDSSGNPVISYYDDSSDVLKYARWDGTEWDIETVCSLGDAGRYTSLAFDNLGNPAISYYDLIFGDLKYTHWTGKNWKVETIDSDGDVGRYTSLAFDSLGNAAISYYDVSNSNLKYAQWNGTSWDKETVDSLGDVGSYSSLAFDPLSGNPAISYYDATNNNLKYAQRNGTTWNIETLDSLGDVGSYTSLAFNTSGNTTISRAISYYDATNGNLKYAWRCYDSGWDIETPDSSGNVGSYTSLAFNSSGNPAISYHDATNGDLRYVHWDGINWLKETVDDSNWVGMYTSLAFDDCCGTAGNPAISYYDATNGNLKYARWNGMEWEIETVDSVGLAGRYSSLAFHPFGFPAISYDEAIHDDLRYTQIPRECAPHQPPNQPSNISPTDGDIVGSLTPTISSSAFSHPDEEATHAASQWQVTNICTDYSSPVFDSGRDTSNKTSITIPSKRFNYNTTYYWRVRYQDNCGFWSSWSVSTSFTVHQQPDQPSNISPTDGAFIASLTPTLISSEYSNPDADPHAASQWQVTTVSGDYSSPIFDSGRDTSNRTSITIPSERLSYLTSYYWRVRHQDAYGAWSIWSTETLFTPTQLPTIASVDPNQGNQGQTLNITITGINLTSGATEEVSLGSWINVDSFSVDSATQITASITIADTAILGARDITVTTTNGIATLAAGFIVVGITANVPVGSDVTVALDSTVIFGTVTTEGTITLINLAENPAGALPDNFEVVGFLMDITTTAIYSGPLTLALNYNESGISNESDLRLFRWNGTIWEDITTSVETDNNIIYADTPTLSTFFIGKPVGKPVVTPSNHVVIYIIIGIVIAVVLFAGTSAYFITRRRKVKTRRRKVKSATLS